MNTALRIAQLERSQEWHAALATVDRIIVWAIATGKCDDVRADAIRAELVNLVPLETFVAKGTYAVAPGIDLTAPTTAGDELMEEVRAWERVQEVTP